MLPLNRYFKLTPMKTAPLLMVVVGMIACTHLSSKDAITPKDSSACIVLSNSTAVAPVVSNGKPVMDAAPELPFYKDVLDTKRLFW
jgi:hypothetical protein